MYEALPTTLVYLGDVGCGALPAIKESDECEVLAIPKLFVCFPNPFKTGQQLRVIPLTASLGSSSNQGPQWFHFFFLEIKSLSSQGLVQFKHVWRSANAMVDSLAKKGVDWVVPLVGYYHDPKIRVGLTGCDWGITVA